MRAKLLCLVALVACVSLAYAAEFTLTVPDEHVNRVLNAYASTYPIPEDPNGDPIYTKAQWVKKVLKEEIIATVQHYEYRESVKAVVPAEPDPNIVQ